MIILSTTSTTNLSLIKDNLDEPWVNLRAHHNANMDTLDTTIKNVQDTIVAMTDAEIEAAVDAAYSS